MAFSALTPKLARPELLATVTEEKALLGSNLSAGDRLELDFPHSTHR